jgi:hypothetical protein
LSETEFHYHDKDTLYVILANGRGWNDVLRGPRFDAAVSESSEVGYEAGKM